MQIIEPRNPKKRTDQGMPAHPAASPISVSDESSEAHTDLYKNLSAEQHVPGTSPVASASVRSTSPDDVSVPLPQAHQPSAANPIPEIPTVPPAAVANCDRSDKHSCIPISIPPAAMPGSVQKPSADPHAPASRASQGAGTVPGSDPAMLSDPKSVSSSIGKPSVKISARRKAGLPTEMRGKSKSRRPTMNLPEIFTSPSDRNDSASRAASDKGIDTRSAAPILDKTSTAPAPPKTAGKTGAVALGAPAAPISLAIPESHDTGNSADSSDKIPCANARDRLSQPVQPRQQKHQPMSHLASDGKANGAADESNELVVPHEASSAIPSEALGDRKLSRSELSKMKKRERTEYKRARKSNKKAAKQAKKRRRRSKRKAPVWQVIMLLVGIGLLAYPIVADRISAYQADEAIQSYTMHISEDPEVINQLMSEAEAYNDRLSGTPNNYDGTVRAEDQLIVEGGLPFAWIEFPTLGEQLPIYHGTDESSLQSGVGHLERTSIPIGGNSTHSVLTGHSGMPGSRMFDDIDRLEVGEVFFIHILDRDLAYQVISSEVVWPDEVESLVIQPDRDLVTLITCTPYGVNDHRLLVHAERTDYDEALSLPSNNMALFFNQRTMPFILAIIITVLFFIMLSIHRRRRYPLELGVDKAWNGLSDYTDDKRRFIGYRDAT